MRYYENLYIVKPTLSDEDYGGVVSKFNELIEKNAGVMIKVEEWGKKSLAYDIKKFDKGFYVLQQFCGEPGIMEELKRYLGLDDNILKYQIIKLGDQVDPEKLIAEQGEGKETPGAGEETVEDNSMEGEV
ncbi:MAG TPA: 30S ribosomal protein S6 [Deltaproteobacteria bacterium]|jgi:small subunit ribosomal protein S6|nr:30S ribosomal protein S6 [Deltaproteobacteria bacterium]HIJ36072.1 30S ribosomal protein S6 [Deltaproteobacteria bacterium]HIJ40880.1 30S ribosomal protein S6 [Deltaproteobacteria bacterium]HIJ41020.1 30S ribosomal protein S6 [Deltaproteobacteria bacterium]